MWFRTAQATSPATVLWLLFATRRSASTSSADKCKLTRMPPPPFGPKHTTLRRPSATGTPPAARPSGPVPGASATMAHPRGTPQIGTALGKGSLTRVCVAPARARARVHVIIIYYLECHRYKIGTLSYDFPAQIPAHRKFDPVPCAAPALFRTRLDKSLTRSAILA